MAYKKLSSFEIYGEVAEWLKAHAWKVCIRQRIEGSNPSLSAIKFLSFIFPHTCNILFMQGLGSVNQFLTQQYECSYQVPGIHWLQFLRDINVWLDLADIPQEVGDRLVLHGVYGYFNAYVPRLCPREPWCVPGMV